ncbi:hypothetical protein NUW58_g9770 [Xylaria curta]|uniref:Uncharacterized protein n=1 Tax=Xylaria curta TaxID=42375 RepID=A0ACC1MVA1_9PEZI|nr:hypothetical protein NUW58_g9770 [Xylaria curta]
MATQSRPTNPFETSYASPKHSRTDDWEDWDTDSGDSTSASHADGILIDLSGNNLEERTRRSSYKPASSRLTQHRPVQLPRVKSRARQKTQNAKAGIKVVTDMSLFHKAGPAADTKGRNKFADTAALQALEGNATSPSIGSFAWLKRRPGNARSKKSMMLTAEDYSADLSPDSRPIVIGISVPSDDVGSHQVSPQTAVIETPMEIRAFSHKAGGKAPTPQQLRSVWSPDTEVTDSPYSARRPVSSVYSQYNPFDGSRIASDAPPVPQLPVTVKVEQTSRLRDQDDDDDSSPCTPFEEDDFPIAKRKSQKLKPVVASPESASSRAYGWWDHVTTPFTQQSNNPFKVQQPQAGSSSTSTPQEWWSGRDEKKSLSSKAPHLTITTPAYVREREANTLDAITPAPMQQPREQSHSEKANILLEESQSNEAPPPYEYSKTVPDTKIVLTQPYVSSQPIPSPGPITPGFSGTMSSQGGINLADVPLTPSGVRPVPSAVLPDRVAGSYRTGDHFHEARGKANKSERQRRRHEKEDVMARKLGGFWRGRGCIPEQGCYGRSGREGRKRRRVCLGVLGGVIAAIILIVVLVVVLTKQAMSVTEKPSESESQAVPNHWLNLTDFPPMPTGIVTVAGPNNSVAVSGCFSDNKTASTAWSCALPKEEHDSVSPYNPTQPEFIFQIQFDNQSQALWKLADRAAKPGQDRKTFITDPGFDPQPEPPSLEEMRFLGNTTDNIRSDRKEGEPTPFFISLLKSIDKVVGPDMLTRRQGNAISGPS